MTCWLKFNICNVECLCNPKGSESLQCNDVGSCTCKLNVGKDPDSDNGLPEKCDFCLPKFYGFPECKGNIKVE